MDDTVTGWRGVVFVDAEGRVWEWDLSISHPYPVLVQRNTVPVGELDLTDVDRQLLADLKVGA
jgi:hypothetical protein